MKKSSHSAKSKKKPLTSRPVEDIAPLPDAPILDDPAEPAELAADNFEVTGREDEAASSGHRVEPVKIDPEENNAQELIEEGLHGFRRASPNRTHRGK
jgi:hypothetical protein